MVEVIRMKEIVAFLFLICLPAFGFGQTDSLLRYKAQGGSYYYEENYRDAATTFKKISDIYRVRGNVSSYIDYENKWLNSLKLTDRHSALVHSAALKGEADSLFAGDDITFPLWYAVSRNIADIYELSDSLAAAGALYYAISDTIMRGGQEHLYIREYLDNQYSLCLVNENLGRHLHSIQNLESSLEIIEDKSYRDKYFNKLGELYRSVGNFEKSNQYYFELVELEEDNSIEEAYLFNAIGNNFLYLKKSELAIQYYLKSLDLRNELLESNDPALGVIYNNLGNMYKLLGKNDDALMYYNKALDNYSESYGEPSERVGFIYNSLGNYYFDIPDYNMALDYYSKGLANRLKTLPENHQHVIHSYYNIANSFIGKNELDSAEAFISKAKFANPLNQAGVSINSEGRNINYLKDYAFTLWLEGRILFQEFSIGEDLSLLEASLNSFLSSVGSYYRLLAYQDKEDTKLSYVDDLNNSIKGALNCYLEMSGRGMNIDYNSIFDLFEKAHNSQLFDLLKKSNASSSIAWNNDRLKQLEFNRMLLDPETRDTTDYSQNTIRIAELNSKLNRYNLKSETLDQIEEGKWIDVNSLNSLFNYLGQNTFVFQVIADQENDKIFYLTLSQDYYDFGVLARYGLFREKCETFIRSIKTFDIARAKEVGEIVSETIIEAFPNDFDRFDNILVIPDDFFWDLQFDALISSQNSDNYLVEDFNISQHLSCQLLVNSLADSRVNEGYFMGVAPFSSNNSKLKIESIPSSKEEVIAGMKRVADFGIESISFFDAEASLESFMDYAPSARILHIATHFDYTSGDFSQGLLLNSAGSPSNMVVVGYPEVLFNGASPDLVVLSACNSSSPFDNVSGEGPINLNRAFVLNNSKNIIYSNSKISDVFSEKFFEMFYDKLDEMLNYNNAFQQTKRELINHPVYNNPFFWSSFQYIGDMDLSN